MKINGIEVKGKEFAYDGCHKIYIITTKQDKMEAEENGYSAYPIERLEAIYENEACGLRFISSWDTKTSYVLQDGKAVFEY